MDKLLLNEAPVTWIIAALFSFVGMSFDVLAFYAPNTRHWTLPVILFCFGLFGTVTGMLLLVRVPLIKVLADPATGGLRVQRITLLGRAETVYSPAEIEELTIATKTDDGDDYYRLELRLLNGQSIPMTESWTGLKSNCEMKQQKLNLWLKENLIAGACTEHFTDKNSFTH